METVWGSPSPWCSRRWISRRRPPANQSTSWPGRQPTECVHVPLPLPPLMWGARICPCRAAPAVPALAWGVYSVNTLPSPAKWSAPAAAVNQFSEVWFSCASRSVSEGLRQLAAWLDFFQLGSVMPKVLLQLCLTWFTFVQLGSTISVTDLRVNYETHTAILTFDCTQSYYFNWIKQHISRIWLHETWSFAGL